MAAVRHNHIELGYTPRFSSMERLRLLMRAIKRVKGQFTQPKRAPITIDHMKTLKNNLRGSDHKDPDKLMLWAAFTTASFGFLRSSEFCSRTSQAFEPSRTLLVKDVSITGQTAFVNIKISKTDPFREGQIIRLAASNSSVCPVRALQNHLRNCNLPNQPLFTFADASYLSRQILSNILKSLLPKHNCSPFSSHSFRIGAATTAAAAGIPEWLIKVLGRWSSDCYERYIKTPATVLERVPFLLCSSVVSRSAVWQP